MPEIIKRVTKMMPAIVGALRRNMEIIVEKLGKIALTLELLPRFRSPMLTAKKYIINYITC